MEAPLTTVKCNKWTGVEQLEVTIANSVNDWFVALCIVRCRVCRGWWWLGSLSHCHIVTLSRCHVFVFEPPWGGEKCSKNSIYKYIFIYTILWAFFTPSWRFKNKNVTTWQCDNVTMWQRTKPSSSPTHPTTNNAKSYKPIIYTICDSYLQLFNPCPLVTFYSCQRRLHTLLLPSLLAKKLEKREEIPKKMRNFVGSFDCIDKLKYALRQPFEQ